MVVDERQWQDAVRALRQAVGETEADALISRFLEEPARREDVRASEERLGTRISELERTLDARVDATREALEERIASVDRRVSSMAQVLGERMTSLEQRSDERAARLGERMTSLEERSDERAARLEERIDRRAAELTATVRGELNAQMRSLLFGFVGLQATIGAFVIGLVRFGL